MSSGASDAGPWLNARWNQPASFSVIAISKPSLPTSFIIPVSKLTIGMSSSSSSPVP
ncbi:hypothetical protein M408DRAFT_123210 [Serendipita vermifera MAFF 305830]|uniref:Uncharacterized protein n=1 Tax=Serendipita vermifera MAFF 305830 TaxID=933852 RepID=A0A0C2W2U3_SERVB|nr:hypothetical protein M408DRAFT_123210 [Serendipita vermifera MAFF 305830]